MTELITTSELAKSIAENSRLTWVCGECFDHLNKKVIEIIEENKRLKTEIDSMRESILNLVLEDAGVDLDQETRQRLKVLKMQVLEIFTGSVKTVVGSVKTILSKQQKEREGKENSNV